MIDLTINQSILKKHKEFILGENKENNNRLYKKLEKSLTEEKNESIKQILLFLINNIENTIVGNIYELERIRSEFCELRDSLHIIGKDRVNLYKKLKIFIKEYEYFYNSPNWNAYAFQQELDITVCPYCNTQYIFNLEYNTGRTRATFDHFFDKTRYPFLAISIYNLVPCCKVCNSDFKGRKETSLTTHYSPYETNISRHITFSKEIYTHQDREISPLESKGRNENIDYVSVILGNNNEFNIKINHINANDNMKKKIKGNKELFFLEEIYNTYHKPYVQDIIIKAYIYNYTYRQQLTNTYSIFNNPEELKSSLIPSFDKDHKTLLGKLTREIIEKETKHFMI
ncbi:hypothetical protein [Aquisalibacillus elongatus]|uniref:Uncharacterized protein n=1 Tax=Aquisalibacillus elongatus TaxID=485577 RepID=A0A3N5BEC8_9BACI|nr:hypothetical protein [Aquisalibacillus elongatus]RPF55259.1 hypothetical protein EDC24_0130 [Aquisalibacillus elongatus]